MNKTCYSKINMSVLGVSVLPYLQFLQLILTDRKILGIPMDSGRMKEVFNKKTPKCSCG